MNTLVIIILSIILSCSFGSLVFSSILSLLLSQFLTMLILFYISIQWVIEFIFLIWEELFVFSIFAFIISSKSLESIFPWIFFIYSMREILFIEVFIIVKYFISWNPMQIIIRFRFSYFKSSFLKEISNFLSLFHCKIFIISLSDLIACVLFLSLWCCLLSFYFGSLIRMSMLFFNVLIKEVSIKSPHVFSKFLL